MSYKGENLPNFSNFFFSIFLCFPQLLKNDRKKAAKNCLNNDKIFFFFQKNEWGKVTEAVCIFLSNSKKAYKTKNLTKKND